MADDAHSDHQKNQKMKKLFTFLVISILAIMSLIAQDKPLESIVFSDNAITFAEYPGLSFKISEPYLRYQKWDTEHTGDASFAIALELINNSEQSISAINFSVKLYDNSGGTLFEGTVGAGPMTFEPQEGNVLKPGYQGVYDAFVTRDKSNYGKSGKLEFSIRELKTASASLNDEPVFPVDWLTFEGHDGLEFQLSDPYVLLDDLSGSELFAIAMKFKNSSGNPIKSMYFNVRIFDEIGVLIEQEIQEHNQKYLPEPKNFMDPNFPTDYEGIDKKFFVREKSLFNNFKKIEIDLVKVE